MKQNVYHPPASALPPGFRFPKAYLDYVNQEKIPELAPWFFLCFRPELYDGWVRILRKQYPDRQLVPFAKWSLDDDIACFEPSDNPDLPGIHYIHSFTSPGYEERGYCATFEEWLEVALEEAAGYQADFPEEFAEDEDDEDEE